MKTQLIAAGSALLLGGCVANFGDTNAAPVASSRDDSVRMSAPDVVQARRATYFLSTQAVGQIKAGIDEGGDLRRTVSGAKMLAAWAKALPTMFPEGTNIDGSRALDNVWSDRAGFEARADDYRQAAEDLAQIAASGDRAAADAAFKKMAGTCHACHAQYREE